MDKLDIKIAGDSQDLAEESSAADFDDDIATTPRHSKRDPESHARREGLLNYRNRTERRKLARSVVGTSQYMAPEVILGHPYDGRCDWWSIGIILYECLYGRTPFFSENRQLTKESIVAHRSTLSFPRHDRYSRPSSDSRLWLPPPSKSALDLMRAILVDKDARLSSRQYRQAQGPGLARRASNLRHVHANGADEIKAHAFFRGVPWAGLHARAPPFVPRVRERQSIAKYFEDEADIVSEESSRYESCEGEGGVAGAESEKAAVGLQGLSDAEFRRVREHYGAAYGRWRVERVAFLQQQRQQGEEETAGCGVRRERKRPRDKVLRDVVVGKKVMEMRKRRAFFGYTYRRPRPVVLEGGGRRGRVTVAVVGEGGEG
ncbi:hypothetical protein WHR41_06346 [Cladosporium halotolerans]|uniref:non-specific serine/threonine protein kinase n=1 Tax=Cladosporium halotolerans TaxID=1052096 RepID=A0AB34KMC4_9PEZI